MKSWTVPCKIRSANRQTKYVSEEPVDPYEPRCGVQLTVDWLVCGIQLGRARFADRVEVCLLLLLLLLLLLPLLFPLLVVGGIRSVGVRGPTRRLPTVLVARILLQLTRAQPQLAADIPVGATVSPKRGGLGGGWAINLRSLTLRLIKPGGLGMGPPKT